MSATRAKPRSSTAVKAKKGLILDLGSGREKSHAMAVGMDIQPLPGVDIVHDWNVFPWPLEDESVLTILAINVVEHVNPADLHFVRWMNECWRVLRMGGQMAVVTPYAGSPQYWSDPTHINGCTHMTFWYFDPDVRVPYAGGDRSLYGFYEPAPWKLQHVTWQKQGMLELTLCKRPDLADYHTDGEVHYR